jgi:hypothetical protein
MACACALHVQAEFIALGNPVLWTKIEIEIGLGDQGRDSPIVLQFFDLFSIFFLNCF